MNITKPKLKAMLLFFCNNTNSIFLGKTKLMKLFYFADFLHVKRYGSPITFDKYINLEHGPIPSGVLNLINAVEDDMDNSILADTIYIEYNENSRIRRIRPVRDFTEEDKKYFLESELDILKIACKRFKDKDTKTIVGASHKESPWKNTRELEEIPYFLATGDPDCLVDKSEIDLIMKITKR